MARYRSAHLDSLEAEAIHIFREAVAETQKPVMLYSIGKDSSVLLRLAEKAFSPGKLPFPLLHVDTTWKFQEMYALRDEIAKRHRMLIQVNEAGVKKGINPFDSGSEMHTRIMKTESLRAALDAHRFDAAFGGARRDEEKSRAKERIFSFRSKGHRWEPRAQRPEPWRAFNTKLRDGETVRVFPLSNWTELDIWRYIEREEIPIVPLYFARPRPVVEYNETLIMVDDDRVPSQLGPATEQWVRFRTLGCYPLTGAVLSKAQTLPELLREMEASRMSERQGRVIDRDGGASMEAKKREGYF